MIPHEISRLSQLKELYLGENPIEEGFDNVCHLTRLVRLTLNCDSMMTHIPIDFSNLVLLESLRIGRCDNIWDPPFFLLHLPRLAELWIDGDPFQPNPTTRYSPANPMKWTEISQYKGILSTIKKQGTMGTNRAKLMIVGDVWDLT